MPALRLTIICAVAAMLGSVVAHYFGLHGAPALAIAMVPASVAYLWFEFANLMQMVRQAFSSRRAEPLVEPNSADAAAL